VYPQQRHVLIIHYDILTHLYPHLLLAQVKKKKSFEKDADADIRSRQQHHRQPSRPAGP